jgi:DNA-binding MarR family transcriptional regulator
MRPTKNEEWDLYEKINEIPGQNKQQLADIMGWTDIKTRRAIDQLLREGLITITGDSVTSKPWREFFTSEELQELRTLKF